MVGLAVGFGAQTIVKDVITGFFIIFENQFDVEIMLKSIAVERQLQKVQLNRLVCDQHALIQ